VLRLDHASAWVQAPGMLPTFAKVSSVGFLLALFAFSEAALACDGEGKNDKDEPKPSVLCDGEGKNDKDEPKPSFRGGLL
jgi:hypothetical protein